MPIALGYINYGNKTGGVARILTTTGDVDKDMIEIKKFYQGITPKHPEMFRSGLE